MDIWFICIIYVKMCFLRAPEVDACNCDSLPQQVYLISVFWSKREPFVTKCVFRSIIISNQITINLQDRRLVWGLSHSWHLGCCCWKVLTKHCQRHNGPDGWVQLTKPCAQSLNKSLALWPNLSSKICKKLLPTWSSSSTLATVTTSTSFELPSSHARVTSIKFTKCYGVS